MNYEKMLKTDLIKEVKALNRKLDKLKKHDKIEPEKGFGGHVFFEEEYQDLIEKMNDGLIVLDKDNIITYVNPRLYDMLGYEKEDLIGHDVFEFLDKNNIKILKNHLSKRNDGNLEPYEIELRKKDKNSIYTILSPQIISDKNNKLIGSYGVITDITKQKVNERIIQLQRDLAFALNSSLSMSDVRKISLKAAMDITGMECGSIYFSNEEGNLEMVFSVGLSKALVKAQSLFKPDSMEHKMVFRGEPKYIVINKNLQERYDEQDDIKAMAVLPIKHGKNIFGCLIFATKKYTNIPIEVRKPVETISAHIGNAMNRVMIEEELRKSKERYKTSFDNSIEGIALMQGSKTVYANKSLLKIFGYKSLKEFTTVSLYNLIAPESKEKADSRIKKRANGMTGLEPITLKITRKDNKQRDLEFHASQINIANEQFVQITFRDVTNEIISKNKIQQQFNEIENQYQELEIINTELAFTHNKLLNANKKLAQEKERLSTTLRSLGEGFISIDNDGKIDQINKFTEDISGWEFSQAKGKPVKDVLLLLNEKTGETIDDLVTGVLTTNEIVNMKTDTILITKDGDKRTISAVGAPIMDEKSRTIGAVILFRDITERKKMEIDILKSSKIDSLGVFAGGIAHDFNNMLTAIMGNISLVKHSIKDTDENYETLSDAEKVAMRARDLTQQLLTFSKGGAPIMKTTSIKELLIDTVNFVLSGSNVKCDFQISEDVWNAKIDEAQISQVIHNIVLNARQAMPKGGKITINAENTVISPNEILKNENKNSIIITIKDEGEGIHRKNLQKIFDPYFSTKENGTGLGLSVTYSIIKKHDGHISVKSKIGSGTTFEIYLPASTEKIDQLTDKVVIDFATTGKILLMDDEKMILDVGERMLSRMGFDVVKAKNGEEAIELYKKSKTNGEPFKCIIMDLTIPDGMGGKETIEILKDYDPDVKAIVSSGYSNDPVMANFKDYGFIAIVEKPYRLEEIKNILQKIL
ncbi:PAS domain S-box protein [Spirochaetota bacterium]